MGDAFQMSVNTNTKFKELARFDARLKKINSELAILGVLSVICMVVELEWSWDTDEYIQDGSGDIPTVLKGGISGLTLLMIIRIFRYYRILAERERQKFSLIESVSIWRSSYAKTVLLETLVCLLHSPPFADTKRPWNNEPYVSDKLQLFIILRLYVVARVLRDNSSIYIRRREITAEGADKLQGTKFSWWITLKFLFSSHPVPFVCVCTVLSVATMSYCVYVCEREAQPTVFKFGNTMWFTCVTMTTVGYGDMVPQSDWGQFMAVLGAVYGIILASLLVAVMMNKVSLSPDEAYAFGWVQQDRLLHNHETISVLMIQNAWRYKVFKRDHKDASMALQNQMALLKDIRAVAYMKQFRRNKLKISSLETKHLTDPIYVRCKQIEKRFLGLEGQVKPLLSQIDEYMQLG